MAGGQDVVKERKARYDARGAKDRGRAITRRALMHELLELRTVMIQPE